MKLVRNRLCRHTLELLRVWFQTTAISWPSIKRVTYIFWLLSAYEIYVSIIVSYIKCEISLCLKNTLMKKYLITKNANHHLSLQCVIIFLLLWGLASMFMVAGDQGGVGYRLGWLRQFLKVRQQCHLPHNWLFLSGTIPLCSKWSCLMAFYPQ